MDWKAEESGFDSRRGALVSSLARNVRTGSGAHVDSFPMRTGGSFPGGKEVEEYT
jgi:hypothetical protein